MSDSCWKLANHEARLTHGALTAQNDLHQPALRDVTYQGQRIADLAILGMAIPSPAPPIADAYVRGNDLVVTYAATQTHNVRVQVYWRCVRLPQLVDVAAIDLQISVQTPLLDSDPWQLTHSKVPTGDVYRLDDRDGRFVSLVFDSVAPRGGKVAVRQDRTACYLVRPGGTDFSYAEMVHPADVCSSEFGDLGAQVGLAHELFKSALEKGVILRARLRGALVPRDSDETHAAALYADLLAAEPPLTT